MSPEYALGDIYSEKSDVYSFGVLILEIISCRKASHWDHVCETNLLMDVSRLYLFFFVLVELENKLWDVGWLQAQELWREDKILELIDPTILESFSAPKILRCIHIDILCVQEVAENKF
jgi:serine/threonine protein kinase